MAIRNGKFATLRWLFCFLSLCEKFEENYLFLHRILWHNKMEAKPKTKNIIVSLLECKRELRDCIQKGADPKEMKRIASKYGFKFATPV